MVNTHTTFGKLTLGIGILALVSGLYFMFQEDYTDGILGVMVGGLLLYFNTKKIKDEKDE